MAFPENKWSSKYAEILNDTAERLGIKEIYYYNFKNDRSNNNHYYENIVKELSSYVPYLDNDNSDIYAPTLIGVKDGNIVFYDDETSIIHGDVSIDDYWTNDKIASKMVNLGILLQKYLVKMMKKHKNDEKIDDNQKQSEFWYCLLLLLPLFLLPWEIRLPYILSKVILTLMTVFLVGLLRKNIR